MTWYELDKERLVVEHDKVTAKSPGFRLGREHGELFWQGEVVVSVAGVDPEPLRIRLHYPESFPATAPFVEIIQPQLDPSEIGHAWHRWIEGFVCYVSPRDWSVFYTGDEIIAKVADWYFNYVAFKRGMISSMPDLGRAELTGETPR